MSMKQPWSWGGVQQEREVACMSLELTLDVITQICPFVLYFREELRKKYSSNANVKIDEDYTRTKQDFYRMDLDRMQVTHMHTQILTCTHIFAIKECNVSKPWSKCESSFCVDPGGRSTVDMERINSEHFTVCVNRLSLVVGPMCGTLRTVQPPTSVQSTGLQLV